MNLGAETACALGPPRPLRLRLDPPRSDATPVAPSPCAQRVRVCACVCAGARARVRARVRACSAVVVLLSDSEHFGGYGKHEQKRLSAKGTSPL